MTIAVPACTPTASAELAARMASVTAARLGSCTRGWRLLVPSTRDGAITAALRARLPRAAIETTEPDLDAPPPSALRGITAHHRATFEHAAASGVLAARGYDAVIMIPPFTLPDRPHAWVDHLTLAWALLRPGGTLVAITPNALRLRATEPMAALRRRLHVTEADMHDLGLGDLDATGAADTAVLLTLTARTAR